GAIACGGGGDGPTGPGGGGGGGGGENLLTARFNDVPWTATPSTIAPFGTTTAIPGSLSFYGATISGTTRQLALMLGRIPGPGTYPLGMNSGTGAGGVATILEGSQTWTTPLSGAAGAVTITTLTDTRVAGTFAFEATPLVAGTLSPVTVTEGRFDVPLNTSWTPVPADQIGSRTS